MSLSTADLAVAYSTAFAPARVVLAAALTVVAVEWHRRGDPTRALAVRVGVLVLAATLAAGVRAVGGPVVAGLPNADDVLAGLAVSVGFAAAWTAWRAGGWGRSVAGYAVVLWWLGVAHALVVPAWDVSSHVAYGVAPAGYLAALDRRFAPTLAVPAGLVVSRPLAGAHTWAESLGGLVLGTSVLVVVVWRRQAGR